MTHVSCTVARMSTSATITEQCIKIYNSVRWTAGKAPEICDLVKKAIEKRSGIGDFHYAKVEGDNVIPLRGTDIVLGPDGWARCVIEALFRGNTEDGPREFVCSIGVRVKYVNGAQWRAKVDSWDHDIMITEELSKCSEFADRALTDLQRNAEIAALSAAIAAIAVP